MSKFAEAYPYNKAKGKHKFAVVYCGVCIDNKLRDREIAYYIDNVMKGYRSDILRDIIISNIRAFNCTKATLYEVFPPNKERGEFIDNYIQLSDWGPEGMIDDD